MEGSGSGAVDVKYGSGCGSRRPKNLQNCTDPTDPDADPEHCIYCTYAIE
jgi:hypothetical protein